MEIGAAAERPVTFKGVEWIRVGANKERLKDNPEHERKLWRAFESCTFESSLAETGLTFEGVVRLLDYPATSNYYTSRCRMDAAASPRRWSPTGWFRSAHCPQRRPSHCTLEGSGEGCQPTVRRGGELHLPAQLRG